MPGLTLWACGVMFAMARAAGVVLGLPSASSSGIPKAVQMVVSLSLGIAIVAARPDAIAMPDSQLALAVGLVMELLFGLTIGFVFQLALATSRIAGELIGVEMGLSFAAVADPLSGGQSTVTSSLIGHLGVQLFLAAGLDRVAIAALLRSPQYVKLGAAAVTPGTFEHLVNLSSSVIEISVVLAMPLMGALLCLKVAMGMLARVAPKLQIFSLAFGLSISLGLIMLNIVLPSMAGSLIEFMRTMTQAATRMAMG